MPLSSSRRSREKRIRAHYRKKIWSTGIIMLIIGMVVGFVGCAYLANNNDRVADLLGLSHDAAELQPTVTPMATEGSSVLDIMNSTPTPMPTEEPTLVPTAEPTAVPTPEPTAVPTEEPTQSPIIEIVAITEAPTAEPTAVPTEEPTAVPTAEPTAVPTEEPTAVPTAEPTAVPTAEPTAEPTAVPTPEPTAEPTPVPVVEPVIVPYGEACTIKTEIGADGKARTAADADAYETLDMTLQVTAYKDQAYYVANYADSYILQGNEAAVEFDITLNGYAGSTEILPENVLKVSLMGDDEAETVRGYQLIDAEIEGKPGIVISSDVPTTVYKRYPYSVEQGDMVYMVVNSYVNGVEYSYWFEIIAPEGSQPEPTVDATALTVGSTGDEVKKLQAKLIELGLLSGQPDGKFGNYTAEAVKTMQGRYGMEKTGIADAAFLEELYN